MVSLTAALFSNTTVNQNSQSVTASLARLSAGQRITKASDDVAALATGTALNTQLTALRAALGNASQASSLLQVANGGLDQQQDILQRLKALSVQSSSGTLNDTNRAALDQEFQGLSQELTRLANSTNFNGVPLLNGTTNTSTTLASTNALAVAFSPTTATGSNGSSAANSSVAIQAFNSVTGAQASGGANAGNVDVTDSSGTVLSNAAFNNVDTSLSGGISNFQLSNVNYGSSATITATVGGVQYSGTYTNGSTSAVLTNGNTSIKIATGTTSGAATALNINDSAGVASSEAGLNSVFANTDFQRVQVVSNVDFSGTRLSGVTGTAATGGIATARLNSDTATISNFRYTGASGGANTSTLAVDINGQTFTATGVKDSLGGGNDTIVFQSADNQVLKLDLNGLTTPLGNIRTNAQDQSDFVNALNSGFAKAGGGQSFTLGTSGTDTVSIALGSTTANSLFNGQSLSIASQSQAATASTAIDQAINALSAAQANVGALQSQVDFSSNAIADSIQQQDSARSELLDTNVASESTNFAARLVLLQASIAAHAQGNKLSSSLLKLVQ